MLQWTLTQKSLPLRFVWKISRSSIETKETFFINLSDGINVGRGEVSPNTRYYNTPNVIERDFTLLVNAARSEKRLGEMSLSEFDRWLSELHLCKTLRFGAESAWIELQSIRSKKSIGQFLSMALGLPVVDHVRTSFSVPIMDPSELEEFIRPLDRYYALKIKVDSESAVEAIERISKLTSQKLRIDGNEAWSDPDALMRFVEGIRGKNIEFIEQPMPSQMRDAYRAVLPKMTVPLIADESIEYTADFADLKTQFSGVNIKLMKTGGVLRAAQLLKEAKAHGMKTMLGCMVETSLGISAALRLCAPEILDYADLDGFLLLKDDPFNIVRERDGVLSL